MRFQPGEGPSTDLLPDCENCADGSFAALLANVIVDMDTNYWDLDLQAAANKCEYASCEPENKWKK